MKKIPTIFERDWDGDRSRVIDKANPAAAWVFDGEGVATIKWDGTSCMVRGGNLYKRREIKSGQTTPLDFVFADHDEETGKTVGWMLVTDAPEDIFHREAFRGEPSQWPDGTYELVGPKVQGNPEGAPMHVLLAHAAADRFEDAPRTFEALRDWMTGRNIEGLVWHHPDGRMAKIKLRDFGLQRPRP